MIRMVSQCAVVALVLAVGGPALADECQRPGPAPVMPQGATATAEEMKAGHDSLQSYVKVLETYQDCMEQKIANAPKDTKPEDKQRWRDLGNAAIDAAHSLSDIYSSQVHAYKARTPQ